MEEFKALRAEIERLEKEILQTTFYVFTVSIAIAGLVSKDSKFIEITPILYQIVLIWGLDRFISCSRLKVRLDTYIQVFLEPKSEELNWHNRNANFELRNKFYGKKWILLKRFTSIFLLLYLVGIYVSYTYFRTIECFDIKNTILSSALIVLHIFGLYFLIIGVFYYPRTKQYVEKWNNAKNKEKK